jgi:hypothetical protein
VPKPSLPVRLVLLVAGTTLPLIIFAAVIVFSNYEQDRKDASQRVLETVRSIRLVLDAEVQRMTGALQVLALTNALRDGDSAVSSRASSINMAKTPSCWWRTAKPVRCSPRSHRIPQAFPGATIA